MKILIGCEKGGAGKSMIAAHAAALLAHQNDSVVIVDADPQGSSALWAAARARYRPAAPAVALARHGGDIRADVQRLASEYDHVVIDVGGQDSTALRAGLVVADRVVIPVQAQRRDVQALQFLADLIVKIRERRPEMLARVVFNRVNPLPTTWPRIDEAREAISSMQLESVAQVIKQRVAYDDSEYQGGTVFDSDDENWKAARDEMHEALRTLINKEWRNNA